MPLLREGRDLIASMLIGNHSTNSYYGSSGAVMFVGSGTAAHAATQTALQGNPIAATMEAGYPIQSVNIMQFRGLYATDKANFEWQEWAIGNATSTCGGDTLNRMVESLGTKTSAQSWQLTASMTLTT